MSEAVRGLPPQYQAAVLPFMVGLMDVPYRRESCLPRSGLQALSRQNRWNNAFNRLWAKRWRSLAQISNRASWTWKERVVLMRRSSR